MGRPGTFVLVDLSDTQTQNDKQTDTKLELISNYKCIQAMNESINYSSVSRIAHPPFKNLLVNWHCKQQT